jgi:glycosyltransferase involved in cell wall biosynthesis
MSRVGILGGGEQAWPSLNKTYNAYLNALAERHSVTELGADDMIPADMELVINFSGDQGWKALGDARRPPIAFALHGGAVLDYHFIKGQIANFRPGDCFIGNCESDRRVVESLFRGSGPLTHVLPLPVAADLRDEASRTEARKILNLHVSEFVVLVVARLVSQKNIHHVLELVAEALAHKPDFPIKLIIVGNFWSEYPVLKVPGQKYHRLLQQLIKKRAIAKHLILLPGSLPEDDLENVFLASDVAISMSHSIDENFGYFAVEAMGYGVPVIGTAYGGQKDSIKDGISGWPVPTWLTNLGIRSSFSGLGRMLTEIGLDAVRDMGISAHNIVKEEYSYSKFADRINNIVTTSLCSKNIMNDGPVEYVEFLETPNLANDSADYSCIFENDSLEKYKDPISFFVSRSVPALDHDSIVVPFCEFCRISNQYLSLDPSWPFLVTLSEAEDVFMQRLLREGQSVVNYLNFDICDRLLKDGIIIPGGLRD